jgi:hypothetical protein
MFYFVICYSLSGREVRDSVSEVPATYQPPDFIVNALQVHMNKYMRHTNMYMRHMNQYMRPL